MEDLKKKMSADMNDKEIVFSKSIKAGKTILVPGKVGQDSSLTFKKPDGEFYVLFDAGPGHIVEIDQADIEAP